MAWGTPIFGLKCAKKCPRVPVWLRGGGGVWSLFGQCPNRPCNFLSVASLSHLGLAYARDAQASSFFGTSTGRLRKPEQTLLKPQCSLTLVWWSIWWYHDHLFNNRFEEPMLLLTATNKGTVSSKIFIILQFHRSCFLLGPRNLQNENAAWSS